MLKRATTCSIVYCLHSEGKISAQSSGKSFPKNLEQPSTQEPNQVQVCADCRFVFPPLWPSQLRQFERTDNDDDDDGDRVFAKH